ncbi:cyclic nucleotide-binding domain-containing protein [Archangium sp.]|uniref:cyclic nucleotide-binding domain-containing protein n=1 Tax=Archangium sp. TaxID=1872627 RepID=UPI002D67263E|nr:cyclic nucleotide-binding domain-containing protein [Archangium sp.]HYO51991.1 cyclic nucleotide-binding domain-containing protein [Archangium sp.]
MEPRQLRDKANEALTKGRFSRAAELFEEYCQLDPKDHQARVRLGDAWVKVGDNARAISAYHAAAEGFAREGLLPRAIAASKLILELDPSHQGVQQMLANLYARRGEAGGAARAMTPSPLAAPPVRASRLEPTSVEQAVAAEPLVSDEAADASAAPPVAPAPDIEVELDLSDAEMGSAQAAPPGLRRRSTPHPLQSVDFQPPVPGSTPFAELVVQADSLLHAVELAALACPEQPAEPASSGEEPLTETAPQDEALPKIPLFSDLPRDAFIALFEHCPLRRFPEGARIIEQGTKGDAFYVICAGRVRIVRQAGAGQHELAVLGEGAFFGEMALLSGAPRSASVVSASEETQVLEISTPVLAGLSRRFPQVARALRRFCRQRLLSDVMNTSALFQPFGRKDRRELVERFRAREVRRGDTLIHEGDQVDGLYVVLSGEVAITRGGQSLARLREGELFGEMSLLQKTPATATVTAVRNTSLLRLPREDFNTLILTHPQILALVSELTEARQRSNEALLGGGPKVTGKTLEPHEELVLF